jgi:hypothetical protein
LPTFTDVSKSCGLFTFKFELLDSEAEGTTPLHNFGNNLPIITALITSQNISIFGNTTERYTQIARRIVSDPSCCSGYHHEMAFISTNGKILRCDAFTAAFAEVFRDVTLCGRTGGFWCLYGAMSGTKRRSTRRHIPEHLNLQASNRLADIQNFITTQTGNTAKLKFLEDCCASVTYRVKVTLALT